MEKNEDLQSALAELRGARSETDEAAADSAPDAEAAANEGRGDEDEGEPESQTAPSDSEGGWWARFARAHPREEPPNADGVGGAAAGSHDAEAGSPSEPGPHRREEEHSGGGSGDGDYDGDEGAPHDSGSRLGLAARASAFASGAAGSLGLLGKGAAVRDTLGAVFGLKPARKKRPGDEGRSDEYPWVEIRDGDRVVYRNEATGETSPDKPAEFDLRGRAAPVANTEATAVVAVQVEQGVWERLSASLRGTPAMQAVLGVAQQVAESEVGQAARRAKVSVADAAEDVREKWETSQNPWVYNASAAYDSLFSENEWGHAIREIRRLDPTFTMDGFALEMRDELVPEIVSAFLRGDRDALSARCSERAMAQLSAALRQREAEGLTVDPNILSINNVDVKAAQVREKGPSVLVFQVMVQQINCTRNRKGEIVEGKDDEIRAVYYAFAVHRVYNSTTLELEWRIDEMAIVGAVLYL